MLDGGIRPTQCPNATDPQVLHNQEIWHFVKSRFLKEKNHKIFIKQVMKKFIIPFDHKHFGQFSMKKLFQNYERLGCYIDLE